MRNGFPYNTNAELLMCSVDLIVGCLRFHKNRYTILKAEKN